MTKKQKEILIGTILGDSFLQKTGNKNARLRFEHSLFQREYLEWKVNELKNYFPSKINVLKRFNKVWNKTYNYVRAQSSSSSEFGKLRAIFYKDAKKIIPDNISNLLKTSLSLAIWFMDDGYYYHRDKMSYIYIPNYDQKSLDKLVFALKENFNLFPSLKKKKKGLVLVFNVLETKKLVEIIKSHIIPSMEYKISLDPVSTERKSLLSDK